eukprot:SAG31_NODE_2943_length_4877_cov_5.912725_4_plen_443_part_00
MVRGLVGPPSKRQRVELPASLTLLAAEDGSRHVVPRIAALGVSELLAELLGEDEEGAEAELVLPVPTSGTATAAFAAFVQRQRPPHPAGPGPGPGPDDGQQPVAVAAAAVAFPAAEWRAAAFFMATKWQRELSHAWAEAISTATAGLAAAVETAAEVMDPAISPLLTMLPAASLAAIFVATGGRNPIGGWVVRELDSPSRRADGWLVVGDDDGFANAKRQARTRHYLNDTFHIVIRPGVEQIGVCAFVDCWPLASVAIPDSVTQIGDGAFAGCWSLASVAIPDSVTQISFGAFEGCSSLASVAIPDSVTRIGNDAFRGCSSLASVAIPDSVTQIGARAFYGCSSLASVAIPDSGTQIGVRAFDGCSSLASVAIPDSVTQIGDRAFFRCSSLLAFEQIEALRVRLGYRLSDFACGEKYDSEFDPDYDGWLSNSDGSDFDDFTT